MKILDTDYTLLLSEEQIRQRVSELGVEINRDYINKQPLFISVLNGAFIFAADLIREIKVESSISFVKLSSYNRNASSGKIKELIGLNEKLFKRDVIIIEDIVDSGFTLAYLLNQLSELGPASLEVAALLIKPNSLKAKVQIRYTGFKIPDNFVIGYGLDFNGNGRNLKSIYFLNN